ncbi:MAG: glycosyltransferase family 39 protein, partial [Nitrospira sp.]|nr:glycosyltransferase family 39 protein [Nitrospira sp.]
YLIGLSLGLGLLSHHMFIFFTAEVGLFILLSGNNRRWLTSKEPYIALVIEAIVASPILIWNMTHNFVMFRHASGMMTTWEKAFSTLIKYIGSLAGVHTPLVLIAVFYAIVVCAYRWIKLRDDKYLMLFSLSAPVIVFIGFLSLGGRTEANWPTSGFITGTISAVYILHDKYTNGKWKFLIKASLVFTILLCIILSSVTYYPSLLYSAGINMPPRKDPANRLYGWEELGNEVSVISETMQGNSFIATNSYGINAELAFYVKGHPQVYQIPAARRFSQYDFWNNSDAVKGRDAVFAGHIPIEKEVEALFEKVEQVRHLVIYDKHSNGTRKDFYIYKCYGYKGTSGKPVSF